MYICIYMYVYNIHTYIYIYIYIYICIYSLSPRSPEKNNKKLTRAPLPSLTLAKASSTFFAKLAVDQL